MENAAPNPLLDRIRTKKLFWIATGATVVADITIKAIASYLLKPAGWQPGDPNPHYSFVDGFLHWTWALGSIAPEGATLAEKAPPLVYAALFWGVILYFVALTPKPRHFLTLFGGGLAFGGIAGNLIDMLIFGGVRNFMELGFDSPLYSAGASDANPMFSQRPLFSSAAVALWLGLALLIIGGVIDARRSRSAKVTPPPPLSPPPNPRQPYGHQAGR